MKHDPSGLLVGCRMQSLAVGELNGHTVRVFHVKSDRQSVVCLNATCVEVRRQRLLIERIHAKREVIDDSGSLPALLLLKG